MTLTRAEAVDTVRPFYDAFASGDLGRLDDVFDANWQDNTLPPNRAPGLTGMKAAITFLRSILPDVTATIEDARAQDDCVIVRIVFRGTNLGGLPHVPANGAPVSFLAFDWHRIVGERIVESWHLEDNLSLMIQLGAIPPLS